MDMVSAKNHTFAQKTLIYHLCIDHRPLESRACLQYYAGPEKVTKNIYFLKPVFLEGKIKGSISLE